MAPKRRRRSARKTKRTFFIPQSFPESVQNHMHFLDQWSWFLLSVYSKTGKARKTKRKSKRKARKGKKTKKKSRRRRKKKKVTASE